MRNEKEMLDCILNTAIQDQRIRGAYISGSRVNQNAPKDIFQDYDIMYVVKETRSFQEDKAWIDRFGERLYMQYPEDSAYFPSDITRCYGWLMQFTDGNRLDLHVCTLDYALENLYEEKMYKILLDKDGVLPKEDNLSDAGYWIQKPTEPQFQCTCNEFWWCMNNVAKGLWRGEVLYVLDMLNLCIRPMLTRMLEFKIGIETDFSVSVGKSSKYMDKWLPRAVWERYLQTYSNAETSDIWASVFMMCNLFDETALFVSEKLGFSYNLQEAQNSRQHLQHVYQLPQDAKSIY